MLVRVNRARLKPGVEDAVFELLRAQAAQRARVHGLISLTIARRMDDGGPEELVAITFWEDLDSLISAMGPDWYRSAPFPGLAEHIDEATVDHFETVISSYSQLLETAEDREPVS